MKVSFIAVPTGGLVEKATYPISKIIIAPNTWVNLSISFEADLKENIITPNAPLTRAAIFKSKSNKNLKT